jgi:hypothetical protein
MMKTKRPPQFRYRSIAAVALLGSLALPAVSDAQSKYKYKYKEKDRIYRSDDRRSDVRYSRDHARRIYHSHPRSSFVLSFGTGYAGQGYYWGPPGASYYYERPGVMYYRNRYSVPRYYSSRGGYDGGHYGNRADVAVQRALYRLGYYRGPIDGDIGPGTRRAIARFEADRGLPVRGYVNRTLLDALGII